jgi:hypothetical protein
LKPWVPTHTGEKRMKLVFYLPELNILNIQSLVVFEKTLNNLSELQYLLL